MLNTFPRPSDNPHVDPMSPHCCRQGSYYAGWALPVAPARWEQVSRAGAGRRGAELAASARTTQRSRGKASMAGWPRSIRRMPCNSEGRAPLHAGPEHVLTQPDKSDLAASFARGGLREDKRAEGQGAKLRHTDERPTRWQKQITHTRLAAHITAPSTRTAATTCLRSRALRLCPARVAGCATRSHRCGCL